MAISKVSGVSFASISEINGVAKANIAKLSGVENTPAFDITSGLIVEYSPDDIVNGGNWASTNRGSVSKTMTQTSTSLVQQGGINTYYLDGTDDYLSNMPQRSMFQGRTEWTMHMWMRLENGGNTNTYNAKIFSFDPNGSFGGASVDFRLVRIAPDRVQMAYLLDNGTQYYLTENTSLSNGGIKADGNMHHITWTHNVNGYSVLRIDNVVHSAALGPANNDTFASVLSDTSTNSTRFGNVHNGTWGDGQMYIGYIGFWDYYMNASDVTNLLSALNSDFGI